MTPLPHPSTLLTLLLSALTISCTLDEGGTNNFDTSDWTDASHGRLETPDYTTVFDQQKVKALHIKMTSDDWKHIQSDMKSRTGSDFGSGVSPNQGTGRPLDLVSGDPEYVALSLFFEGTEWYKVGFRLKGNSTLASSWRNGIFKLPFRLNFDRFEDDYPQIKNQRFFGFKELSFSPGAKDNSLIREKLGSDILHAAGVPAAMTAFYQVFIDFGAGEKYCGVYTMVEVIDDTMVRRSFESDDGNIYKPESRLNFFDINQFEKKNNEAAADYSDIHRWLGALNSSPVIADRAIWRQQLEAAMDVDRFLKWLAVNTTMVNWDSYGIMSHNYYLYNHPENGITWIPWDHNEVMNGRGGGAMTGQTALSISLSEVTNQWPLIYHLIREPLYEQKYRNYVSDFSKNVFTPEKMNAMFEKYHALIAPYVVGPIAIETGKYSQLPSLMAFQNSLQTLQDHVIARKGVVAEFMNE